MECALSELDRCLGHRKAGKVISGNHAPSYKDIRSGEDPLYLTLRVLILPMMENLGYGRMLRMAVFRDWRWPHHR